MIERRYRKAVGGLEAELHQLRNLPLAPGRRAGRPRARAARGALSAVFGWIRRRATARSAARRRRRDPRGAARRPRPRPRRAPRRCCWRAPSSTRTASRRYLALGALLPHARRDRPRDPRCTRTCCCAATSTASSARSRLADLAADFRQGGFLQRAIASYEEVLDARRAPRRRAARARELHGDARDHERAIELARRLRADRGARRPAAELADLWVGSRRGGPREGNMREARRAGEARAARATRARCARGSCSASSRPSAAARRRALAAWSARAGDRPPSGALVYPQHRVRLRGARPLARLRGASCAACSRSAPTTRTRASRSRARSPRAARSRRRSPSCAALLERDPEQLDARAVLGRLLLAEHRDAEATKEYAELLDVLERARSAAHAGAPRVTDERSASRREVRARHADDAPVPGDEGGASRTRSSSTGWATSTRCSCATRRSPRRCSTSR